MTTNVDLELLAEHLEGGLAGTPEEARVAQLVATDPEWARAATELSAALGAVAADLRTLPAPSLPADVAARLDAALQDQPAPEGGPRLHGRPGSLPGADRRPPGRARPRPRRLAKWGAGIAVAAGVVAFAAVGIGAWVSNTVTFSADEDAGGAAQDAPQSAGGEAYSAAEPLLTASGIDHSPATLAAGPPPIGTADGDAGAEGTAIPPGAMAPQAPPLARLGSDPALAACLDAVAAEAAPAPGMIDVVDFASFEGEPALVIWLTTADGEQSAWVAGPDCGTGGAGADIQFSTPVS